MRPGQTRRIRVSLSTRSGGLQERYQDVESSSPELDRLIVDEKLAPMRKHLEAT
jgi:hypothetical protein